MTNWFDVAKEIVGPVPHNITSEDRKRITHMWKESSCVYPDPETGGHIEAKKHTYDWTDVCIFCAYPRWGRCRLCGKPLTSEEHDRSEAYDGKCYNCWEEVSN